MVSMHPTPEPYYSDAQVSLYLGKFEDVLPTLDITADLIVTDPPYGETSLDWDRWPKGWPTVAAAHSRSMWCFGSARMFDTYRDDLLRDWRMSQDVVWSKGRGVGGVTDRFHRTHEHARHYYIGAWGDIYHDPPREEVYGTRRGTETRRRATAKGWHGTRNETTYTDDGMRMIHSVFDVPGIHRQGGHPTEKPATVLGPLVAYACPPNGLVLDLFAGSASTLAVARNIGRRAVGIEMREEQCEKAAKRLAQGTLDFSEGIA